MKKNTGFTIIELLVVVMIIGILAGIGINFYANQQRLARDANRKSDLSLISSALNGYYAINKVYPLMSVDEYSASNNPNQNISCYYTSLGYKGAINNLKANVTTYCHDSITGNWLPNLAPTYIPKVPKDPSTNSANPTNATSFDPAFASATNASFFGSADHNYSGSGNGWWFYGYSTKLADQTSKPSASVLTSKKYFLLTAALENSSDTETIVNKTVSYFGATTGAPLNLTAVNFKDLTEWPRNAYVLLSY